MSLKYKEAWSQILDDEVDGILFYQDSNKCIYSITPKSLIDRVIPDCKEITIDELVPKIDNAIDLLKSLHSIDVVTTKTENGQFTGSYTGLDPYPDKEEPVKMYDYEWMAKANAFIRAYSQLKNKE